MQAMNTALGAMSLRLVVVSAFAIYASTVAEAATGSYRETPITAHWTGAVNGQWDNAANWEVEGLDSSDPGFHAVPGVLKNGDEYSGCKADQAIFDRTTSNTNINMGTLVCVSNVTVSGATTPRFAVKDVLPIGHGGTFKVESSVVNTPSVYRMRTGAFWIDSPILCTIENDSAGELVFESNVGYTANAQDPFAATTANFPTEKTTIKGSGDFRFKNYFPYSKAGEYNLYLQQTGTGKITYDYSPGRTAFRRITVNRPDGSDQFIDVTAGYFGDAAAGYDCFAVQSDTKISGAGRYHAGCGWGGGVGKNNQYSVDAGTLLWIDTMIEAYLVSAPVPPMGEAMNKKGEGTLRLTCPTNLIPGVLEISEGCLEASGIGMENAKSQMGTNGTAAVISAGARLRYIGAGETSDKKFRVALSGTSHFEHAGTGDLVFTSATPFIATNTSSAHVVKLYNTSGCVGAFSTPLAMADPNMTLNVASGAWRFTGANTFTGTIRSSAGSVLELSGDGSFANSVLLENGRIRVIGGDDTPVSWTFPVINESGAGKIVVEGKADIVFTSVSMASGSSLDIVADLNDVTLTFQGKTSASASPVAITLNGFAIQYDDNGRASYKVQKITGDQDVEVSGTTRFDLLAPDNDYTGKTILHGTPGAWIYAMWPGSIPDYSKVEVYENRITVPVEAPGLGGQTAWSDEQILSLANSAKLAMLGTNAVIAVDTSESGDHTLTLSDANVTSSTFGIGSDGTNRLIVTGSPSQKVFFASYSGTLEFNGNTDLKLGSGTVSSDYRSGKTATVVFDGVTGPISDDDEPIIIGGRRNLTAVTGFQTSDSLSEYRGHMIIRNSRLSNSRLASPDASNYNFLIGGNGSKAGMYGSGVLEIAGETTSVTGLFNITGNGYRTQGAVYQYDGEVVNWAGGANGAKCKPYFGYMGQAYWELSRGSYKQLGMSSWGTNQGVVDMTFAQYGGEALFTRRENGTYWYFGAGKSTSGADNHTSVPVARYYIRKGQGVVTNMTIRTCSNYKYGLAEFIVDGPEASLTFAKDTSLELCNVTGGRTSFVINDGGEFATYAGLRKCNDDSTREVVVSLNGGRIKALNDNLNLFGDSASDARKVARVTVYEKGATFDTNGKTVNLYAPLLAPAGKGIVSASATASMASYALVAPPLLHVYDGAGGLDGMVMAEFDRATHSVTNVRVLCPGSGYTSAPSAYAHILNECKSGCVSLQMADNPAGGGIVKTGEGTLVLGVANTYSGDTVVSNGVLKLAAAGAIPDSTVKLCGGKLDVADGVAYPVDLTLDVSGMPCERLSVVAENWTSSTLPNVVGANEKWAVERAGNRLVYHRSRGICLSFK